MSRARVKIETPKKRMSATEIYALVFGLFLGLAILKFGNPAILDRVIAAPTSGSEAWSDAWPLSWANGSMAVFGVVGVALVVVTRPRWPGTRWLWILPTVWFGWQVLSATQSVDGHLTAVTMWQLGGCAASYFLGALVVGKARGWRFVMVGLFAAFAFCLVRAVNQRLFEFPREREFLMESQREGWTNIPPETFQELKQENVILNTNGVDIPNPAIIAKYEKGRVQGTLVYPNALAGTVLLLWPMAMVSMLEATRRIRPLIRLAAITLTVALGAAGMFFSGSKGGWLIALGAGVVWLCRLNWPRRFKWIMVMAILAGGLAAFGLRFHSYFAKGATSVGARFDYWRVAAEVAIKEPMFGSGPGTFQRRYEKLKKPESEMARLVHNDYLEQFSDSGFVGGMSYAAWIILALWTAGRRAWSVDGWLEFAVFVGLLGWFVQGLMEFSLYVPALAWTAFAFAGCLLRRSANQFDKPLAAH